MRASARAVLFAALAFLLALATSSTARAQAEIPEVHLRSDADVIGLGDTFRVTMQALSSTDTPSRPELESTVGFAVIGISPSTSTQMNIMNGTMSTQRGLTNVWTLRATKLGTFTVGPATVVVGGKRYVGPAVSVKVVPAGQAPPRQLPQQNAFDPFGGLFGNFPQMQIPGFDEPLQQAQPQLPPADPRLSLDSARGSVAFLHATIDKPSAVVGEQVTYSVYLYIDTQSGREPDPADPHEAPATDFIKRSLQADDAKLTTVGYADVSGRLYVVALLRKLALFPLKTGDLDIGEMTIQLSMTGGGIRKSEDIHVHVGEPPIQGRPPSYSVGNVGQFSLTADVSGAKDVEQDGAIGVTVTLSGNGNLPSSLDPPERAGVEWLDPQVTEKVGAQKGDKFGGTRTFQYVVRLHNAGDVDLGDFTLAYWEPQNRVYQIARAPLGIVHVKPGARPAAADDRPSDPLPGLPAARTKREPTAAGRRHLDDAPSFWIALGATPLAYVVVFAMAGAVGGVRRRRAERGSSPEADLRLRIRAAEEASAGRDAHALDAATARALEAATIAGPKLNVRGLATSDVARALADAGIADDAARETEDILRACDAARFSADASAGAAEEAQQRWQRARRAIDRLAGLS